MIDAMFAALILGAAMQVGSLAPDFTLLDDEGQDFKLSAHRGKNVVLAFFPKSFTPG
jgi:peroxiredoxin Q/BCP